MARRLINWCVLLLWFAATYHCAFEHVFSPPIANSASASHSSDSALPFECPSHTSDRTSPHSEGSNCGSAVQIASSTELRDATPIVITPSLETLVLVLSSSVTNDHIFIGSSDSSSEAATLAALSQLGASLSIAPNAPPVTLA
jgi:hypothetical protein